jgi:hypothetical protein
MEVLKLYMTEIIGGLTTVLSFFVGRRLKKANVESSEIGNLKAIIDIQSRTIERMEVRILYLEKLVYDKLGNEK